MTEPHPDLTTSERWAGSLERSRRRRAVVPLLRRGVVARRRHAGVMVVAVLAGSGGWLAVTGPPGEGSGPSGIALSAANQPLGEVDRAGLRLGSSGPAVLAVERRLRQLGYFVVLDRYFDRRTHRAVRRFQRSEGLRADGVVGAATWRALFPAGSGAPTERGGAGLASRGGSSSESAATAPASRGGSSSDERSRTRFAVRMAAARELSSDDRERLGLGQGSLGSEGGRRDGALVAIEFENGTALGADASARGTASEPPEPAGDAGDRRSTVERPAASEDGSSAPSEPSFPPRGGEAGPGRGDPDAAEPPPVRAPSGARACGSERLIAPVAGATFTSAYRSAHRPSHAGIDLAAPTGTPIRSAACGIVSLLQGTAQTGGYGNYICVKHSSRLTTCYAHLSRFSDEGVGDRVRQGEVIGYVGNTGHSTGPHLHFETRTANPYGPNDVDPAPYLAGRPIPGTRVGSSAIGGPDLAFTPRRRPSLVPEAPAPLGSGAPDAPAGADSPSPVGDPAPEAIDEASAGASKPTAPAAMNGLGDPGYTPEGETRAQEPTAEATDPSSEDPTSAEPPPADEGGGPAADRGGIGSPLGEEEDAAPSPASEHPFLEPPAPPFSGVDSPLTPDVDPAPAGLPFPVSPGEEEGQAVAEDAAPPELLPEPEGG